MELSFLTHSLLTMKKSLAIENISHASVEIVPSSVSDCLCRSPVFTSAILYVIVCAYLKLI